MNTLHRIAPDYDAPPSCEDDPCKAIALMVVINALRQACIKRTERKDRFKQAEADKARTSARAWLWENRADVRDVLEVTSAHMPDDEGAFEAWLDSLHDRISRMLMAHRIDGREEKRGYTRANGRHVRSARKKEWQAC